jgi:hypothetical protein
MDDDAQLAAMGHRPELKRNFSTMSVLSSISSTECCLKTN